MATMIENINRIKNNIQDAYNVIQAKGGTIPQVKNTNNLVNAIQSIDIGSQYAEQVLVSNDNEIVVPNASLKIASLDKLSGASRKGKNLLKCQEQSGTHGGVTITKISENHYTFKGTTTVSSFTRYIAGDPEKAINLNLDCSKGIIFYASNNKYGNLTYLCKVVKKDGTTSWHNIKNNPYVKYDGYIEFIYIQVNGTGAVVDADIYFQAENGTEESPFEPYTSNLLDSKVDVIVSKKQDTIIDTKTIPQAVQDLDGYGIVGNYIEYKSEEKKWEFHKTYGIELLKNITFSGRYEIVTGSGVYAFNANFAIKPPKNTSTIVNAISSDYVATSYSNAINVDKSMYENTSGTGFRVRDDSYTNLTDFVNSLGDKVLYYELPTPVVTDITNLFPPNFYQLMVEEKGTIEFHYPALDEGYVVDTPSQTTYIIDTSKL